jgi:uncharacterized membrane protein
MESPLPQSGEQSLPESPLMQSQPSRWAQVKANASAYMTDTTFKVVHIGLLVVVIIVLFIVMVTVTPGSSQAGLAVVFSVLVIYVGMSYIQHKKGKFHYAKCIQISTTNKNPINFISIHFFRNLSLDHLCHCLCHQI